jgi:hypothetical protein
MILIMIKSDNLKNLNKKEFIRIFFFIFEKILKK